MESHFSTGPSQCKWSNIITLYKFFSSSKSPTKPKFQKQDSSSFFLLFRQEYSNELYSSKSHLDCIIL